MEIKNLIRTSMNFIHLDLTKNLEYDRLTKKILKEHLQKDSNCIDIGCHKGEILEMMLKYSPDGTHYAFEPIPDLYEELLTNYGGGEYILIRALKKGRHFKL